MTARISGAKGGGGGSRTPVEGKNTLRSVAYGRLVDLITEGEAEGLVNGMASVYLDDTPLQNPDGTLNFNSVGFYERRGTQAQDYVPGFSQVENTIQVGVEVKQTVPVVRQFTNPNLDAVRLTLGFPTLIAQDAGNGDTFGTSVDFQVDVQTNGGGFVTQPIGFTAYQMSKAGLVVSSFGTLGATRFSVAVSVSAVDGGAQWSGSYSLAYRIRGATAWTPYGTRPVFRSQASAQVRKVVGVLPIFTVTDTVQLTLPAGEYEFQVTPGAFTGSNATLSVSGTAFVPGYTLTVSGKTTSRYQRSVQVTLPGSGPWDVRVRRLTANSGTQYVQNQSFLDATTEIIEAKLAYPNSAYVALSVDASQFTSIPRRAYHMRGVRVKVPSNYDPASRAYSGVWDGTFKVAWTDNPAWCYYDLLTNTRYGLGEFVPAAAVDKWALYAIGQYCDALVPDGMGGVEPRYTCNLYLQTRQEAFRVLADMTSIFRGMAYWSSGSITAVQDSPADPAYLYSQANVIDGTFNYAGSALKARHTVALVTWNDPADFYKQKVEYVEDSVGIKRQGVVPIEVAAVGCCSRGQANRVGRWILFTERLQSEVVTFRTGLDGNLCRPGQVIKVADSGRAAARLGGRVVASTVNGIALDAPVTLAAGVTYTLSTLDAAGKVVDRAVTTAAGTVSSVSVSPPFSVAPDVGSVWVLSSVALSAQLFRVIGVTEADRGVFEVSALAHDPGKYDAIENGVALAPRTISAISARPAAPVNGSMTETLYEAATDLKTIATFTWDAVAGAASYSVSYRRADGNPVQLPDVTTNSATVVDAIPGVYEVTVRATNQLAVTGPALTYTVTVLGKTAPPVDVSGLQIQVQPGGGLLSWASAPDLDVRLGGKLLVRYSTALVGATWTTSVPIAEFSGASTSGAVPLLTGTYLAKFEDASRVESLNAALVVTNAADVVRYNAVVVRAEQPAFSGVASGLTPAGSVLQLSEQGTWDDIVNFDAAPGVDGATVPSGVYAFASPIDLGAVYTSRLTADIAVLSYDVFNIVDQWASVDAVPNIDGALAGETADIRLYIGTTNDDPAGVAPVWSDYRLFTVGAYTARAFRFRLEVVRGPMANQQVQIQRLGVTVDVPDRVEGKNLVTVPPGGLSVVFAAPFYSTPAIAITADAMATGDYYTLSAKSPAGFTVQFFNAAGTPIARTMDWIAKGFGYKQ